MCESATTTYTGDLSVKTVANSSKVVLTKSTTSQPVSTSTDVNISLDAGTYTISVQGLNLFSDNFDRLFIRDSNNNIVVQDIRVDASKTFTISSTTIISKVIFVARANSEYNDTEVTLMLNTGSQPLPYEPYSSEVWHDIPHYIHNTSTDTLTTLPADIYANDTTATVGLKGNMSQSSTPSPQTPIQPQECGERTANLFDKDNPRIYNGYYKAATNQLTPYPANAYIYVSVEPNKTYFIYNIKRYDSTSTTRWVTTENTFTDNSNVIRTDVIQPTTAVTTITTGANERFLGLFMCADVDYQGYGSVSASIAANCANLVIDNGYKIPILNNSQTTNVYLGEVESTRRIKKLVLTGEEEFGVSSMDGKTRIGFSGLVDEIDAATFTSTLCSHYKYKYTSNIYPDIDCFQFSGDKRMWIGVEYGTAVADFKSYLAQQYAAGTPVCVWYVLATPQTAVVNEPIRKIGTYTDTVSGITIPVTAGANTLSVDTTLQPSEVTATYKGWHPVADVHERENGAWD